MARLALVVFLAVFSGLLLSRQAATAAVSGCNMQFKAQEQVAALPTEPERPPLDPKFWPEPDRKPPWPYPTAAEPTNPPSAPPAAAQATTEKFAKPLQIANSVRIFDPADVEAALGQIADTDGVVSLRRTYEAMKQRGPDRFVGIPRDTEIFNEIAQTMPNFAHVVEFLRRSLALSIAADASLTLPPLLLLGPPGVGKTFFSQEVARVIGTEFKSIPMSSMTAGWILSGSAAQWRSAKIGKVADTFVKSLYANPVFLVDEIDKATGSRDFDPIGSLYQLFEYDTARVFTDEFLAVPIDTTLASWILTANDRASITGPILSRLAIFEIAPPSEEQKQTTTRSVYRKELAKFPKLKFSSELDDAVVAKITTANPRDIRKILYSALGNAALARRQHLIPDDIDMSMADTGASNPIGFLK